MNKAQSLPKLIPGDKVAILSPSFAAPGVWPHVHALGLQRLREIFELEPVEFPSTAKVGASKEERAADLVAAFSDQEIKAVIASIGGDDQVTYIKNLPPEPFMKNPKPFFGYSDNSHFCNFLFQLGIPSFYGGSLFTQLAMQKEMDAFTIAYMKLALFGSGEFALRASDEYNDQGLDWSDASLLQTKRPQCKNEGWHWEGDKAGAGRLWGGCIESVDEMLRHNISIPSLEQFENIILILESSEELPTADYVRRVVRALGERGILTRIQGVLIGRAKAWEFDRPNNEEHKETYRENQRQAILKTIRTYNPSVSVVQNLNFGHTDPQIPMPYGNLARINPQTQQIFATF